jgi:hypothetical protein
MGSDGNSASGFLSREGVARVDEEYLEALLDAVLKGDRPAKVESVSHGCLIRYKQRD